jgi:hypothetical protein
VIKGEGDSDMILLFPVAVLEKEPAEFVDTEVGSTTGPVESIPMTPCGSSVIGIVRSPSLFAGIAKPSARKGRRVRSEADRILSCQ